MTLADDASQLEPGGQQFSHWSWPGKMTNAPWPNSDRSLTLQPKYVDNIRVDESVLNFIASAERLA